MKIEAKKCSKCGKIKALYDYYKGRKKAGGLRSECKKCSEEYTKTYRERPEIKIRQLAQTRKLTSKRRDYNKGKRNRLKLEVFSAYGGECACCGENNPIFLSIDHIKGGGTKHRNSISKNSIGLYRWLRKNNYPPGFQVLCFNCNRAKHFNGTCPHQLAALLAKGDE